MSYSGTVHCGYCGQQGHNRTNCTERKRSAERDPSGWTAVRLRAETEERARVVENRRCSYCAEKGHNRRGCKTRKLDVARIEDRQADYVDNYVKNSAKAGLGRGALLRVRACKDPDLYAIGLLQDIHWQNLWFFAQDEDITRRWSQRDKRVFSMRITSLEYDRDKHHDLANSWNWANFQVNKLFPINHADVVSFIKKSYHKDFIKNDKNGLLYGHTELQILGASKVPHKKPKDIDRIPPDLKHRFNLEKRASHHDCARMHPDNVLWESLYPEKRKENHG